jgi:hypothetical protein
MKYLKKINEEASPRLPKLDKRGKEYYAQLTMGFNN